MICEVRVGGASVCFPPNRRSLWAIYHRPNVPDDGSVVISAYLTFMRHIARETGLHGAFPSPGCVLRYEGTVLFWWSLKLTYRTQVAILMPARVRTNPCRTFPLLVPYADKAERSCSSGTQIGVSTCGSDTRPTSKKLPSMSTPCSNMATVFCGTLLFTKKMSLQLIFQYFTIREFHLEVEKTLSISLILKF